MELMDKITNYVEEFHMIKEGESVVAGVSGGADSVCLLFFLKEYQKKVSFQLYCVHVEHGIRDNANEDAEYVKTLCDRWEIPIFVYHVDIPALAKERRLSEEEAGRIARYELFDKTLKQVSKGQGKIAVAHHKNDQAETILLNLFRGSGLKGLSGISPVRDQVIRPLLDLSRQEIEEFLKEKELSYQTDETNLTDEYTRNRIRHHILQYADSQINEKATEHVIEASKMISMADEYFRRLATDFLDRNARMEEYQCVLPVELLQQQEIIVQKYILKAAIEKVAGKSKDITDNHIEAVRELLTKSGSKQVSLPYELEVRKEYERLSIQRKPKVERQEKTESKKMIMRVFPYEKNGVIPQKKYTKWFSYDKIEDRCKIQGLELVERTRCPGDYLIIDQHGHTKKLKEYFIEAKIPKTERDQVRLLTIGQEIIWIVGYRINEAYKVTDFTKEILEVRIEEEE